MTHWFAPLVLGAALLGLAAPAALAEPPGASSAASPTTEATKHFRRGVALYNEADYRGALIEFKRAYEIAPNASVLYNVGETYYQLQNYAAALSTLERYLNEAGTAAPHRREVEQTLETLRTRVGNVQITTNVPDCEITVDDDLVGKTPLKGPVMASVGRRKIIAMHNGRAPETRFVEVSAGDTTEIALSLTEIARPGAGPAISAGGEAEGINLVKVGWITTGVLAAGTVGTGIWAYTASRQLQDARHSRLDHDRRTRRRHGRDRDLGLHRVAPAPGRPPQVPGRWRRARQQVVAGQDAGARRRRGGRCDPGRRRGHVQALTVAFVVARGPRRGRAGRDPARGRVSLTHGEVHDFAEKAAGIVALEPHGAVPRVARDADRRVQRAVRYRAQPVPVRHGLRLHQQAVYLPGWAVFGPRSAGLLRRHTERD
jgi:hypothetical protein